MVISDEPGYYAAGRFGIRHENLLLVQPAEAAGFLRFETLTLAPFDRDALDPALLTASERDWLHRSPRWYRRRSGNGCGRSPRRCDNGKKEAP